MLVSARDSGTDEKSTQVYPQAALSKLMIFNEMANAIFFMQFIASSASQRTSGITGKLDAPMMTAFDLIGWADYD